MRFPGKLLFAIALSLLIAGSASAVVVNFQQDSFSAVGGAFPVGQTYVPPLPLVGSGNIDFGTGTGTLMLPDYSVILDVSNDLVLDAQIDTTGWMQTITSIDGLGNITSTGSGSVSCTVLGGLGGFVCPSVAPTVGDWGIPGVSAVINTLAQTITVVDTRDANAGTITLGFSYSIVPEPGTALLVSCGLFGLGLARKRRVA